MENNVDGSLLLNLSVGEPYKKKSRKEDISKKEKEISLSPPRKKLKQKATLGLHHASSINQKRNFKEKNEKHNIGVSGLEHVMTSSLFKSNPEIPSLSICPKKGVSEPLFSNKSFDDLDLHPHLVSCLKDRLEIVKMTKVQEETIPKLLDGRDCLVKSCTGSGKTLCYAVPIVQKLQEISPKIKRSDGTFSLVVVPTRELALQCFESFCTLTKAFTWIVPGYLIGGEKKKSEKARLRKGINILICTPGRLLDHLDHTACLTLDKIQWLIIDEADRLLEQGFEESVHKIVSKCHNFRQTVLLSATLSKGVERLAGMSLTNPVHIDLASKSGKMKEEFQEFALPSSLKQSIVIVPSKLRLTVMSAFIMDNCLKGYLKGLIFMCSQNNVDFHYNLFNSVFAALLKGKGYKCKFYKLHGNMKQEDRTEIFSTFRSSKQGVLLCTDVAARGLDLPQVDWLMQYSAPPSTEIYVHRVGRTARIGKKGSALLFLLPSENKFSQQLSQHKIQFEEIDASKILQSLLFIDEILTFKNKATAEDCATALQIRYEKEVNSEEILLESAKKAFGTYVQSYASYPQNIKDILPFKSLHLGHVAKSFCLREAPSQLRCHKPYVQHHTKRFRKSDEKRPQKRKQISEYDSGLSYLRPYHTSAEKRRKRP